MTTAIPPSEGTLWRHKPSNEVVKFVRYQRGLLPSEDRYLVADVDAPEPHEMAVALPTFYRDYEPCQPATGPSTMIGRTFTAKMDGQVWQITKQLAPDSFELHRYDPVTRAARPGKSLLVTQRDLDQRFASGYAEPGEGPPPPPAPAPIGPGSVVCLTCDGPNTPHMSVASVDTSIGVAHVLYVPVYGQDGRIIRDSFPLSSLRVVTPSPDPRAPDGLVPPQTS